MSRQLNLIKLPTLEHGGDIRKGKRKIVRPLDPKRPLHVVLRSTRAKGPWSLLHRSHRSRIQIMAHQFAEQYGVKLYQFANVGNHLHLLALPGSRAGFQAFLRRFSGAVSFLVTGARKGNPVGRFWEKLAYSRVISWGRELGRLKTYFVRNLLEGFGLSELRDRVQSLSSLEMRARTSASPE